MNGIICRVVAPESTDMILGIGDSVTVIQSSRPTGGDQPISYRWGIHTMESTGSGNTKIIIY